ncbi:MAG: hypothetical protein KDJ47_12575 [Hyphomicrobiaceae bacterium]|nr:hypothetical protein [Hyphomicrobiaceae bacterium]
MLQVIIMNLPTKDKPPQPGRAAALTDPDQTTTPENFHNGANTMTRRRG